MFNKMRRIENLILGLLLIISMVLTGCGGSNGGGDNPPIGDTKPFIDVNYPDVWITGPLNLSVWVYDPIGNPLIAVNNVKLYVDGIQLATDTKPEETTSCQVIFPNHTWESRNYNSGIHTVYATASTSKGDLKFERTFNIRHYMPEFIVQGPNLSSYATAKLKRYDTDTLISDAAVNINNDTLTWNG